MIKLKQEYRTTTAIWKTVNDSGEVEDHTIRVQYRPLRISDLRQTRGRENNEEFISDLLLPRLHSLPDIVDDNGQPIEITIENLDAMPISNLRAIFEAISEDENPKSKGGSSPAE